MPDIKIGQLWLIQSNTLYDSYNIVRIAAEPKAKTVMVEKYGRLFGLTEFGFGEPSRRDKWALAYLIDDGVDLKKLYEQLVSESSRLAQSRKQLSEQYHKRIANLAKLEEKGNG